MRTFDSSKDSMAKVKVVRALNCLVVVVCDRDYLILMQKNSKEHAVKNRKLVMK